VSASHAVPSGARLFASGVRKTIICTGLCQENGQTIFTATGTTIDLGTLGDFSIAIAINSAGHVSGYSPPVPNGPVHAFFYNRTMQDLGTLRSGAASYATSLNDQDLVVGNDALNRDSRPWIWSATSGTVDLTTLITNPA
jgi:probable HAF family extracellular repeat protein